MSNMGNWFEQQIPVVLWALVLWEDLKHVIIFWTRTLGILFTPLNWDNPNLNKFRAHLFSYWFSVLCTMLEEVALRLRAVISSLVIEPPILETQWFASFLSRVTPRYISYSVVRWVSISHLDSQVLLQLPHRQHTDFQPCYTLIYNIKRC
jgi:hypothetical protein